MSREGLSSHGRWALALLAIVGCQEPGFDGASATVTASSAVVARSVSISATAKASSSSDSAPTATASSGPTPAPTVDPATLSDEVGDPRKGWPTGYVPSRVRDSVDLDFAGAKETWQLRWKDDPTPACFVEEAKKSGKCLGIDGAGESGKLEIVRLKDQKEIASVDLTELLSEQGPLVLARFPDGVRYSARGLASAPPKPLMTLGDYNQDGVAAELVMQGPMRVWVSRPGVLIGFSPSTGKLFGYKTVDTATWEKVKT
ncbi:MAG: hypothetical protein JNK04_15590, partial [Myxococcales bacterium]|nr:hypothetical protein [Myxococcales bacterium]